MDISEETYNEIAELIHSDNSPVGIDAKKTHIYYPHAQSNRQAPGSAGKGASIAWPKIRRIYA